MGSLSCRRAVLVLILAADTGCHWVLPYAGRIKDSGPVDLPDGSPIVDAPPAGDRSRFDVDDGAPRPQEISSDRSTDRPVPIDLLSRDQALQDRQPADGPTAADLTGDLPPFPDQSVQLDQTKPTEAAPAPDGPPPPAIVITELMIDPKAQDPAGEWFELFNRGTTVVSLNQWQLKDKDEAHTITGNLLIGPGAYLVLGAQAASCPVVDYIYSSGVSCSSELCFANDGDRLELYDDLGLLVDQVIYTYNVAWPYASGISMSLKDPALDNAAPASWCAETTFYDGKNTGSPGGPALCN